MGGIAPAAARPVAAFRQLPPVPSSPPCRPILWLSRQVHVRPRCTTQAQSRFQCSDGCPQPGQAPEAHLSRSEVSRPHALAGESLQSSLVNGPSTVLWLHIHGPFDSMSGLVPPCLPNAPTSRDQLTLLDLSQPANQSLVYLPSLSRRSLSPVPTVSLPLPLSLVPPVCLAFSPFPQLDPNRHSSYRPFPILSIEALCARLMA